MTKPKRRFRLISRAGLVRLGVLALVLLLLAGVAWAMMIRMPGKSFQGSLPPLTADEQALRDALRRDVEHLAGRIGPRNVPRYEKLVAAADFIEASWTEAGYEVRRQTYQVDGKDCDNLEIEIPGSERPGEIVVVGAHYDSVHAAYGCPGANDNASGVAALLALARDPPFPPISGEAAAPRLRGGRGGAAPRTLRFVAFVNEEPPYFQTDQMGSLVYARRCRERGENVVAMFSLETIGYYTDEPGSQSYPAPFGLLYPSRGNFISFVGNVSSRRLVRDAVGAFRRHAQFPSEGGAVPGGIPGVGWSDHWAFWQQGYPAVMVTDTAPFRYPHYHTDQDTPDRLDYDRMARVVTGLRAVLADVTQR